MNSKKSTLKYVALIIGVLVLMFTLVFIFKDDWVIVFTSLIACGVAYITYRKNKVK